VRSSDAPDEGLVIHSYLSRGLYPLVLLIVWRKRRHPRVDVVVRQSRGPKDSYVPRTQSYISYTPPPLYLVDSLSGRIREELYTDQDVPFVTTPHPLPAVDFLPRHLPP
jgi:hypothetical protein